MRLRRLRKNRLLGLTTAALLGFGSFSASALSLDATILDIFTDSSLATSVPNLVIDAEGNATADLAAGNVVLLGVTVANPEADLITAIFATTTVEGSQFAFSLGALLPTTMLQSPGGGTSLENLKYG